MKIVDGNCPLYLFDILSEQTGILHFISSRAGNIGFTPEENPETVIANRFVLADTAGFTPGQLVVPQQVHSDRIKCVGRDEAGLGAMDNLTRISETDALMTDEKGVCLMVMSADCVPVLLYDPVKGVIAAVHAGWRGTVVGIAGKTVRLMHKNYNCTPGDILAGIGPSIGKCCFEVGTEVAGLFNAQDLMGEGVVYGSGDGNKSHVDLWEANRRDMLNAGILPEHIEVSGICTVCRHDSFFSYRYDKGRTGRFGVGIMLRE